MSSVQLQARGIQDVELTGTPETFFFRSVYKQYVDFELISQEQVVKNTSPRQNTTFYIDIQNKYEFLSKIYISFESTSQINAYTQFEYVDLEIGGQTIVHIPFEYMYIYGRMRSTTEKSAIYQGEYFGSHVDINLTSTNIPVFVYYIEFPIFMQSYEKSLPLYLLQQHAVRLKFKTTLNANLSNFKVYTDYIHIERKYLPKEYPILIEQIQDEVYGLDTTIDLELNNPIKEIYWVFRKSDFGNYGYSNIFNEMKVSLNGVDIFTRENYFYNLIQPFQYHTNIPKDVFMFSFSLRPEVQQPYGTLNASRLRTFQLKFDEINTIERRLVTDYKLFQQGVELLIKTLEYNSTLSDFKKNTSPFNFQILEDIILEYYTKRKPTYNDTTNSYSATEDSILNLSDEFRMNLSVTNSVSNFVLNDIYDIINTTQQTPNDILKNLTKTEVMYQTGSTLNLHSIVDGGFMLESYHGLIINNENIEIQDLSIQTELNDTRLLQLSTDVKYFAVVYINDIIDIIVDKVHEIFSAPTNIADQTIEFNPPLVNAAGSTITFEIDSATLLDKFAKNFFFQYFRISDSVFLDIRKIFNNFSQIQFIAITYFYNKTKAYIKQYFNNELSINDTNYKVSDKLKSGLFIIPIRDFKKEMTYTDLSSVYKDDDKRPSHEYYVRLYTFPIDKYFLQTSPLANIYINMFVPSTTMLNSTFNESFSLLNTSIGNITPSDSEFVPFLYFYMKSIITLYTYIFKKVALLFYQLPYQEGQAVSNDTIFTSTIEDIRIFAINYNFLDFSGGKAGIRYMS